MRTSPDETQTYIEGYLEVHHARGVVYFHANTEGVNAGAVPTPLRIQGLGNVPSMRGHQIDAFAQITASVDNRETAEQARIRRSLADVDPAIHRSVPPSARAYPRYADDGGVHLYEDE